MKAQDVLHHETLVNNNVTLKTIHTRVGIFSPITTGLHAGVAKGKHSNKAREAYERTPVIQHYQVGLTIGLDQVL